MISKDVAYQSAQPLQSPLDQVLARVAGVDHAARKEEGLRARELTIGAARTKIERLLRAEVDTETKKMGLLDAYGEACGRRDYREAILFLEGARQLGDEPQLALNHGRLCLILGDFQAAYDIFLAVCKNYRKLTPEQAHEALWFLFKSWHSKAASREASEEQFEEEHRLLEQMRSFFEQSDSNLFLDVVQMMGMTLAFRRGEKTKEISGIGQETGYYETIRRGRTLATKDSRMRGERGRLMGAAYLKKVDDERGRLTTAGRERESLRKKLLEWLEKAKKHNLSAIAALKQLSLLEGAGETFRVLYNHAKTLETRAEIQPGENDFWREATEAIRMLEEYGGAIRNPDLVARARILRGELARSGRRENPTSDDLKEALRENLRALEAVADLQEDVTIDVLFNVTEILIALGEIVKAKNCLQQAIRIYETTSDERIVKERWALISSLCDLLNLALPRRRPTKVQ